MSSARTASSPISPPTARSLSVAPVVLWAGYTATAICCRSPLRRARAARWAPWRRCWLSGRFECCRGPVVTAPGAITVPPPARARPDGVPLAPLFVAGLAGPLPAPLRLPLVGVAADGCRPRHRRLGACLPGQRRHLSRCGPDEQEALVAGFARFLNSLAEPIQILRASRAGRPHPTIRPAPRRRRRDCRTPPWRPAAPPMPGSSPSWPSAANLLAARCCRAASDEQQWRPGAYTRRAAEAATALGAAG